MTDDQLAALVAADDHQRVASIAACPELLHPDAVRRLTEPISMIARADLGRGERTAAVAQWLADKIGDDCSRGRSERAGGHVAQIARRHADSLRYYARALEAFARAGNALEEAITLTATLHPLGYLGRYDEAFRNASRAREIFEAGGDRLRLARLETNLGNILYRQDHTADALAHYERAYEHFQTEGTPQDLAVTLRNLAVCNITLNNFERALDHYRAAALLCREHKLVRLTLENDYNIAYLYYLRGEYTRAIELYNSTRELSRAEGDAYHQALCDLDQAELYLELNLSEDGGTLARQAFTAFEQLQMRYEAAKALAFVAIAAGQQGQTVTALQIFGEARERFRAESNAVWPALIDLYVALVLFDAGRSVEAQRGAEAAFAAFEASPLVTKTALTELLLARVHLHNGDVSEAENACRSAIDRVSGIDCPGLVMHAYTVLGQVYEQFSDRTRAFACYEFAQVSLEKLRSRLNGEELKIAFVKNKQIVFESLVHLAINGGAIVNPPVQAFKWIEQSKSRNLAELISFRAHALPARGEMRSDLVDKVRSLREELNWYYHQIDIEQFKAQPATDQLQTLRQRTRDHEAELGRALDELRETETEYESLQDGGTVDVDAIQSAIPAGTALVEYYEARGLLYACVVKAGRVEVVPVTAASRVRKLMRLLTFQFSKFRLGEAYVAEFERALFDATRHHLAELYEELVGPLARRLDVNHLIIVPHGFLHYLPFHALFDGEQYLCDRYSISYAPSGNVFRLCSEKPRRWNDESLVLAVPDQAAPHILTEARSVSAALPGSHLFVGEDVTEERLQASGRHSRFVHIAAHGTFRYDNPMFSSIRLGASHLTLFDLYRLDLNAELVTLSGCGTGLNVVVAGDEILGLTRGVLYAGAHSVIVTLWEVNDLSTASLMSDLYRRLPQSGNRAAALRDAMRTLRERYPHPYYWAPFVLSGSFRTEA